MNCIVSLCLHCCCLLPNEIEQLNLPSTIEYAKEMRLDPSQSPNGEEARVKELLAKAVRSLPRYEAPLEEAVQSIVANNLSSRFEIKNANQVGLNGRTSDQVFLIYNHRGLLCYVVKAFQNPGELKGRFFPEINAINQLKELNLTNVTPVNNISFGICHDGMEDWGLLLESAATGKPLKEYINSDGNVPEKAFRRFGQGLAQLHHKTKANHPSTIPEKYTNKFDELMASAKTNALIMERLNEVVRPNLFFQYLEQVKKDALQAPVYFSCCHGDPNLGNVFYDHETDDLYLIDLSKLHHSSDRHGNPLADGALDLIKVEKNFRRISLGVIPQNRVETLLAAFFQAYEQEAGQLPDERLFRFYRCYTILERLRDFSRYPTETDPIKQATDKAVFDYILKCVGLMIK